MGKKHYENKTILPELIFALAYVFTFMVSAMHGPSKQEQANNKQKARIQYAPPPKNKFKENN